MNAALTSAALAACIAECTASAIEHATKCGRTTLSVVVSARRLAEEYGAPPVRDQPHDVAPVQVGDRTWTVTTGRRRSGLVKTSQRVWTAHADLETEDVQRRATVDDVVRPPPRRRAQGRIATWQRP